MLNKFYEQGNDLHVANYMVYGKTADHKLYADATFKKTVTKAEITDALWKGRLLIVEGANYLVPVAFSAVNVVTIDTASTLKAVTWTASAADGD